MNDGHSLLACIMLSCLQKQCKAHGAAAGRGGSRSGGLDCPTSHVFIGLIVEIDTVNGKATLKKMVAPPPPKRMPGATRPHHAAAASSGGGGRESSKQLAGLAINLAGHMLKVHTGPARAGCLEGCQFSNRSVIQASSLKQLPNPVFPIVLVHGDDD